MTSKLARSFIAILLASTSISSHAADATLSLNISHEIHTLGPDGVARTARFEERYLRRTDTVWIARILPRGAHDNKEHQSGGHDHKHMDLAASARWFQRAPGKALEVRLIDEHERAVIGLPPTEYGMIGFDGRWESVWNLLDPARLKSFKASSESAPAGARWYAGKDGNNRIRVLWDEGKQYPRRIESTSLNGLNRSLTIATTGAAPHVAPWETLAAYQHKDYSDLLD